MKTVFLLVLLFAAFSTCSMADDTDTKQTSESWMGVYYNNVKIGYLHTSISKDKYEDKDALRREDVLIIRGQYSGESYQLTTKRILIADMDYNPLYESIKNTGKRSSEAEVDLSGVEIKFESDKLLIKYGCNGKYDERSQPYTKSDKSEYKVSVPFDLGARKLSVGDNLELAHFYIWRISLSPPLASFVNVSSNLHVVRSEKLQLDGKEYDTLYITEGSSINNLGKVQRWQLSSGEIIKEEVTEDHITFIRETKEKATSIEQGAKPDISELKD